MSQGKAIIFDVDGTLRDGAHRDHLAEAEKWVEFFDAQVDDTPIHNVIDLARSLSHGRREGCMMGYCPIGHTIIILSGSMRRDLLEEWLQKHNVYYDILINRREGDFTPDQELKVRWYEEYIAPVYEVVAVFDDRNKVVKMWRQLGLTCCQVAEGFLDNEERRIVKGVLRGHFPFETPDTLSGEIIKQAGQAYDEKMANIAEEILKKLMRH